MPWSEGYSILCKIREEYNDFLLDLDAKPWVVAPTFRKLSQRGKRKDGSETETVEEEDSA